MQAQTEQLLADLAWQVEIGADEAFGDVAGLVHWKARPVQAAPAPSPRRAAFAGASPLEKAMQAQAVSSAAEAPFGAVSPLKAVAAYVPASVTAASLPDLKLEIEKFEGCPLKKTAMNLVFADGNPEASVMVIGDVPAEEEDRQGVPFAGAAGLLLDRMLAAIGLDRTSVYLTNLVFWRPPGGRTPTEAEIEASLPFTRQHIALVRPKLIVMMGTLTVRHLLHRKETIARLRGQWCDYTAVGDGETGPAIPCLPMVPPSFLLGQPASKRQAWADLLSLKERMSELSV